jgi:methionyl-tRNA formyltransferase
MGTPEFSIPVLASICQDGHEIVATYTKPDRKIGRGQKSESPPVKQYAEANQIPVIQSANFKDDLTIDQLLNLGAEAIVVAAYGIFLPEKILNGLNYGCLNIHPSLLPKYRGASPVASSILDGSKKTGVTVMLLDEGMDTGPILSQKETSIRDDETCEELTHRLFYEGGNIINSTLFDLVSGTLKPVPQDDSKATTTSRFTKNHGHINWNSTSEKILWSIRAYHPWPGTFTHLNGKYLKILAASVYNAPTNLRPGEIQISDQVLVGTSSGAISLEIVQPDGRKAISANDFTLGYRSLQGTILN